MTKTTHPPSGLSGEPTEPRRVSHTLGPWTAGYWSGACHVPAHVEARHHPGPPECHYDYQLNPMTEDGSFVGIASTDPTADVVGTAYDELKIRYADALLIAAAPDLLAALKRAVDTIYAFHSIGLTGRNSVLAWELYQKSPEMTQINAALAKVEGR
jgi:hypothetical protein